MSRKKDVTKSHLERDPMCKYVVDAWAKRHKNVDIESYLCGAIRVNPLSATADELKFLLEIART